VLEVFLADDRRVGDLLGEDSERRVPRVGHNIAGHEVTDFAAFLARQV
jgi:hypothetical protein